MPARILIVDDIATNRIVLNVKLVAARYEVDAAASPLEARALMAERQPELIILAADFGDAEAIQFCIQIKANDETSDIPVIMIGDLSHPERRLTALRAGADDVLARPVHDQVLLARIRSLLRARNAAAELRLRDGTDRALGLADPRADFARRGQIAVVRHLATQPMTAADRLSDLTSHRCRDLTFEDLLDEASNNTPMPQPAPLDVVLLDATTLPEDQVGTMLPRFAAELRSRTDTRVASQIILLPEGSEDLAAILLDIGVDDVVSAPITNPELSLRVESALRRKLQSDRLRQSVRDGLRAAVIDPLTGLYNRRFVQPHLLRMSEAARRGGTGFAMMILDLDHFKAINDAHGHAVGDRVLVMVAERLTAAVRSVDLVARIGGEEFLVAMPETTAAEAETAARRILDAISGQDFEVGANDGPIRVTMSIGVAMASDPAGAVDGDDDGDGDGDGGGGIRQDEGGVESLFSRADAALYGAKSGGRNTFHIAQSAA